MKNILLLTGAVVIGGGAFVGYKYHEANKAVDELVLKSQDFAEQTSKGKFKNTSVFTKGTFESSGEFKSILKEEDEEMVMVFNYTVDHSLLNMIKGVYPVTGKVVVTDNVGFVKDMLGVKDQLVDVNGEFKNKILTLNADFVPLKVNVGFGSIDITPIKNLIVMNQNTNMFSVESSVEKIDAKTFGTSITNIVNKFAIDMNNPLVGTYSIGIQDANAPMASISKVLFEGKSTFDGKYSLINKLSLSDVKINSPMGNIDFYANIEVDVVGFDKKITEDMYADYLNKNLNEEVASKYYAKLIQSGFDIKVKDIDVKEKNNSVKMDGLFQIIKTPEGKPVDLATSFKTMVNAQGSGDWMGFVTKALPMELIELNGNSAKAKVIYNNMKMSINEKPVPTDYLNEVIENLNRESAILNKDLDL